jgi:hypothetical protein
MTIQDLAALGKNALAWSKAYVSLKSALLKEGVSEAEAREEARSAATIVAMAREDDAAACPLCGRGE